MPSVWQVVEFRCAFECLHIRMTNRKVDTRVSATKYGLLIKHAAPSRDEGMVTW
jgi:hypothetical protein